MTELEYNQESHDYWKNIIDNGFSNLPSQGMISYWLAHIELCHAVIKDLETSTYCAYCGDRCNLDDNAATRISEHIKVCEKHPIHNYKNMIERLVNALEFWSSLEDYVPGEWEHEERKELIDKASKLVGMVV